MVIGLQRRAGRTIKVQEEEKEEEEDRKRRRKKKGEEEGRWERKRKEVW